MDESWRRRGIHEKAQKIRVFIEEGQKVSEKCASENRVETEARRKEGSRRDWHNLNGSRGAMTLKLRSAARRKSWGATTE